MNSTAARTDVKPGIVLSGSKIRRSTDHIITRKLTRVMNAPIADDRRSGLSEKLVMPSMAKCRRPPGEKWVRPALRPLRSYGRAHCRNPSHATMPGR
jgi:hypothetical protein